MRTQPKETILQEAARTVDLNRCMGIDQVTADLYGHAVPIICRRRAPQALGEKCLSIAKARGLWGWAPHRLDDQSEAFEEAMEILEERLETLKARSDR